MQLPSHSQLLLPLLQVIAVAGGKLRAGEAVNAVSGKLQLGAEITSQAARIGEQEVNLFSRRVRWVRQDAVRRDFITNEERSAWKLSERGYEHLENCQPGIVVVIYETENGVALWADAQTIVFFPSITHQLLKWEVCRRRRSEKPLGWRFLNRRVPIALWRSPEPSWRWLKRVGMLTSVRPTGQFSKVGSSG
jgi:hypothetical protein